MDREGGKCRLSSPFIHTTECRVPPYMIIWLDLAVLFSFYFLTSEWQAPSYVVLFAWCPNASGPWPEETKRCGRSGINSWFPSCQKSCNFEQILIDHGSCPDSYCYLDNRRTPEPDNRNEIKAVLGQSRRSLSPSHFSEEDHDVFRWKNNDALGEKEVMNSVFPIIAGDC